MVLPLLRSEVVPPGWISEDASTAGYGAVGAAVPGPLFTFAGYLGTVIKGGHGAWEGGVMALFAIFLPGWLLVGGAYPFWGWLRSRRWADSALSGLNAAVVGVLFYALCRPLCSEAIGDARDLLAAAAGSCC